MPRETDLEASSQLRRTYRGKQAGTGRGREPSSPRFPSSHSTRNRA
jgi:hypothetical protein